MWSESSCAFPKNGTATGSRRERSSNGGHGETKALISSPPGEFQHNYFDFVSVHHSDHDGVVRIFVGHSEVVKRYLHYYAAQFFLYQECKITLRGTIFPLPGV